MWQLAEDTISDGEMDDLADWLRTHPRLTQGDLVREFEARWSSWMGTRDSVFVTSGTTANFALIAEVGRRLGRAPRIGVSAVTWSTNVSPAMLMGYPVVVFDVDPSTLGVQEDAVCQAMGSGEIDVLFVTHLLGFNALSPKIVEAATASGTVLLEDCCEAHGASMGASKVGSLGLAGTFSFYFGHHMSTVEGGMISTNDAELADDLRMFRAHGLARESVRFSDFQELNDAVDPRFLFVRPGLNFRATEINAFLGLAQLPRLDDRIEARNANLRQFLEGAPSTLWTSYRLDGVSSFALPLIAVDADAASRIRTTIDHLGIESRPVVAGNLLRQPFLRDADVTVFGGATPVSDHVHEHGLYIGNGDHVRPDQVERLLEQLQMDGTA